MEEMMRAVLVDAVVYGGRCLAVAVAVASDQSLSLARFFVVGWRAGRRAVRCRGVTPQALQSEMSGMDVVVVGDDDDDGGGGGE